MLIETNAAQHPHQETSRHIPVQTRLDLLTAVQAGLPEVASYSLLAAGAAGAVVAGGA
jgi:hypothetical protein